MLVMQGNNALSPFRLQRLLSRLREGIHCIESVSARFLHLAEADEALTTAETRCLSVC